MKELLVEMSAYNVWANRRIIELLHQQPPEQIDTAVSSSFPSIRKTIYHMWDAQVIWLNRMQGISLGTWPSAEYQEQFAGYDVYFLQQSEDFHRFVETRTDSFFATTCFYKAMNGKEYQSKHWEIVQHCMNHSTYHRGQIITMLRTLGVEEVTSTDLIFYLREKESGTL